MSASHVPSPAPNPVWRGRSFSDRTSLAIHRVEPHVGIHHYVLLSASAIEPLSVSPSCYGNGDTVRAAFIKHAEMEYGAPHPSPVRAA
jgi:hypothetical protein